MPAAARVVSGPGRSLKACITASAFCKARITDQTHPPGTAHRPLQMRDRVHRSPCAARMRHPIWRQCAEAIGAARVSPSHCKFSRHSSGSHNQARCVCQDAAQRKDAAPLSRHRPPGSDRARDNFRLRGNPAGLYQRQPEINPATAQCPDFYLLGGGVVTETDVLATHTASAAVVPEPGSLALVSLALAAMAAMAALWRRSAGCGKCGWRMCPRTLAAMRPIRCIWCKQARLGRRSNMGYWSTA